MADADVIDQAASAKVVPPTFVYRRLSDHLKRLMVVTANGQAVPRTMLGVSKLSLVTAIERTNVADAFHSSHLPLPYSGGEPSPPP